MLRECRTCGRHTDDLYRINSWLICYECARGREFWEVLRSEEIPAPEESVGGRAS
jgi:hypothetical protein